MIDIKVVLNFKATLHIIFGLAYLILALASYKDKTAYYANLILCGIWIATI